MTAVDAPTLLAEVEQRLAHLVAPRSPHPVQAAAARAVAGGKLLRPRLVLAAAGEGAEREPLIATAAAIEVLHAALLVHDDVIDGDDERRGERSIAREAADTAVDAGLAPAAAERLGLATAIVAGDALLVRAFAALARLELPTAVRIRLVDVIERSMVRAAEGEHDDVLLAGGAPDDAAIERILEGKTADYSFRTPLEAGAILAGRDEAAVAALGQIGLRMGIVYQLRDDVLGVFGDETLTGKSVVSDIRAGAPTLLSAIAGRHRAWERATDDYGDPEVDAAGAERVRAAMRESGALAEIERRIAVTVAETRALIEAAPVEAALRAELGAILERCAERSR